MFWMVAALSLLHFAWAEHVYGLERALQKDWGYLLVGAVGLVALFPAFVVPSFKAGKPVWDAFVETGTTSYAVVGVVGLLLGLTVFLGPSHWIQWAHLSLGLAALTYALVARIRAGPSWKRSRVVD